MINEKLGIGNQRNKTTNLPIVTYLFQGRPHLHDYQRADVRGQAEADEPLLLRLQQGHGRLQGDPAAQGHHHQRQLQGGGQNTGFKKG